MPEVPHGRAVIKLARARSRGERRGPLPPARRLRAGARDRGFNGLPSGVVSGRSNRRASALLHVTRIQRQLWPSTGWPAPREIGAHGGNSFRALLQSFLTLKSSGLNAAAPAASSRAVAMAARAPIGGGGRGGREARWARRSMFLLRRRVMRAFHTSLPSPFVSRAATPTPRPPSCPPQQRGRHSSHRTAVPATAWAWPQHPPLHTPCKPHAPPMSNKALTEVLEKLRSRDQVRPTGCCQSRVEEGAGGGEGDGRVWSRARGGMDRSENPPTQPAPLTHPTHPPTPLRTSATWRCPTWPPTWTRPSPRSL